VEPAILLPFSVLLPLFLSIFLAFATFLSSFALLWCPFTSTRCVISRRNQSFALRNLIFFARNISKSISKLEKLIPSNTTFEIFFEIYRNKQFHVFFIKSYLETCSLDQNIVNLVYILNFLYILDTCNFLRSS